MKKIIAILLVPVLFLAGCSFVPAYQRPVVETPPAWGEAGVQTNVDIAADWWESFSSPELNALMARALEYNTDLLAGVQRVEQARAALRIAGATLLPSAGLGADADWSKTVRTSGRNSSDTFLQAGVDVSYELDLFGANRAQVLAAEAGLDSSIYDQGALELAIMGDVATGYFTLASLRERLAIADANLDISREVLRIITARVREGAESEIDLAQQRTAVASTEAARAVIAERIKNAENALAVLLGAPPQTITVDRENLDGVNVPDVAPGQPSELLERRPDIRVAERQLAAFTAGIGIATADLFPTISIFGSAALQATTFSGLFDSGAGAFGVGPSIFWPAFDLGRVYQRVEAADARTQAAFAAYQQTVLSAIEDVDSSLVDHNNQIERHKYLVESVKESENAMNLARMRYDYGVANFLDVLDAERTLLETQSELARSETELRTSLVAVYKALGGGWEYYEEELRVQQAAGPAQEAAGEAGQ